MNLRSFLFLFLVLLCSFTQLFSQAVGEGSETVGYNNLVLEPSLFMSTIEENLISTEQILVPTTLMRYGISDVLELRAQSQYEILNSDEESNKGLRDLFIGAKYHFDYNTVTNSQLALMTTLLVPMRMHGLSNDRFGSINTIIFHKDFSNDYSLLLNLSHSYLGEWYGDINYSLLLNKALTDKLSLYVEPYGDLENLEDLVASLDAGLSYEVSDKLALDLTLGTGLNHKMKFISFGASWLVLTEQQ